ncbi:MAG TPA: SlyX family protein [Nannocystis sp.]
MSERDRDAEIQRLEQRIVELEIKLSFHERTIDDLDAVLRSFTARVEALERELKQTRGELLATAPSTAEVLAQLDAEGDDA